MSVASFVSVHGDQSHNTPSTSTKAALPASCRNAEKRDLSSSRSKKSKSEALEFDRLSIGSHCSNISPKKTTVIKQLSKTAATEARTGV